MPEEFSTATHPAPTTSDEDPAVGVTMLDGHLVVRPPRHLDSDLTLVLVEVVEAALRGGTNVMVDLDPATASEDLVTHSPPGPLPEPATVADGAVTVLGPGFVRLATRDGSWTVDVNQGRMFRSDGPVDLSFVAAGHWTGVRAIWLSCTTLTALGADGTYTSARSVWLGRSS